MKWQSMTQYDAKYDAQHRELRRDVLLALRGHFHVVLVFLQACQHVGPAGRDPSHLTYGVCAYENVCGCARVQRVRTRARDVRTCVVT